MTAPNPVLELKSFSYRYKSNWLGKSTEAVKNVSLTVNSGESFGFLGHNGAGKTTTIKSILGLTRPSSGEVLIFGKPPTDAKVRAQLGYLPEQPYFYDHLTVSELLTMYAQLAGVPSAQLRERVSSTLSRVHVDHKARAQMRALSKGLTQRVAMAQAIVANPKLLILDEPFSGLDPIGRKEFKDLLYEIKESGTTIFISSHILEDIEFLCDRASIMAHGELKLVLDLSQLDRYVERKYELTLESEIPSSLEIQSLKGRVDDQGKVTQLIFDERDDAEKALSKALQLGASISQYRAVHGNLEELFVKVVSVKEAT